MAAGAGEGSCAGGAHSPPVPTANLTGHEEKVSVENFELLKVLGTGGEDPRPPGRCPRAGALGLPPGRTRLGLGQATGYAPHPFLAQPPARPALPCPGLHPTLRASPPGKASRMCQHPWVPAALPRVSSAPLLAARGARSPLRRLPAQGAHAFPVRLHLCLPLGCASSQTSLIVPRFAHAPPPPCSAGLLELHAPRWLAHPLPGSAEHPPGAVHTSPFRSPSSFLPFAHPSGLASFPHPPVCTTLLLTASPCPLPAPQPTGRCSWCGRRAGTTQGSCTP